MGKFHESVVTLLGELKGAQRVSGESPIVWVR